MSWDSSPHTTLIMSLCPCYIKSVKSLQGAAKPRKRRRWVKRRRTERHLPTWNAGIHSFSQFLYLLVPTFRVTGFDRSLSMAESRLSIHSIYWYTHTLYYICSRENKISAICFVVIVVVIITWSLPKFILIQMMMYFGHISLICLMFSRVCKCSCILRSYHFLTSYYVSLVRWRSPHKNIYCVYFSHARQ